MKLEERAAELGYPGLCRYIPMLKEWFDRELSGSYDRAVLPDGTWRLCLGVLVFGSYVDRFANLCVPSLLAPGNLPSLSEKPLIVIHTDEDGHERLGETITDLQRVARVHVRRVPYSIIEMVPENGANKYWLLSAANTLHMQEAKYQSHGYHMLMPDHVYSENYFRNLERLVRAGKQAIVQCNISASLEDVSERLIERGCSIPARELNALALDHMHPQARQFIINGREDYPANPYLMMVGRHAVHILSPHMSIVYLGHDLLMKVPMRLFNTIDGDLPFLIPEGVEPYVPVPDDDMSYIELSDRVKNYYPTPGCSEGEFCVRFWMTTFCEPAFSRFFGLTTVAPLPAGYEPRDFMSDSQIVSRTEKARSAVSKYRDAVRQSVPPYWRQDPITAEAA